MAKILSQEEIDALLANVSTESSFEEEDKGKQKVTVYDFKHPNLVSKEQLRLLETIHEGLARNFGVFLSAQLRMIVEMNLLAIDQIMYSEFVMSIAPPSCIYVCKTENPSSPFVLETRPLGDLRALSPAIEIKMGKSVCGPPTTCELLIVIFFL